jgi:hypothetical protein
VPTPYAKTVIASILLAALAVAGNFGYFIGQPRTKWSPDGRTMTLLADFTYVDSHSVRWTAPANSVIDGASIPQLFWSIVGGPYEGQYRNASIVHDTECQTPHKHDWRSVHRMFYSACRAGGVGLIKGKILFAAVYHFGPRWPMPHASLAAKPILRSASLGDSQEQDESDLEPATRMESADDAIRIELFIKMNPEINRQQIESLTREILLEKISQKDVDTERARLKKFANDKEGDPDLNR